MNPLHETDYFRLVGRNLYAARQARHLSLGAVSAVTFLDVGTIMAIELEGTNGFLLTLLCAVYGMDPGKILPPTPCSLGGQTAPSDDLIVEPPDADGPIPF